MRITCPLCGSRDRREFYYYGDEIYLNRPEAGAEPTQWDDYLHNRDNKAGVVRDLWYHELGCASWLVVTRDTVTHEVQSSELVSARGQRA